MEINLLKNKTAQFLGVSHSGISLSPMNGGGNNRIYQVEADTGKYALKVYFNHEKDTRDRLGSEWKFLNYAWDNGIRNIPKPIACSTEDNLGLYSFIEGEHIRGREIRNEYIKQAVYFVESLNSFSAMKKKGEIPLASEACLSINEHIQTVERRVNRLLNIPKTAKGDEDAQGFIINCLLLEWNRLRADIFDLYKQEEFSDINTKITLAEQCITPSDFGFHNALIDKKGTIFFIDFEYAGLDNPAKLICDFFNQVAVPVPLKHVDDFKAVFVQSNDTTNALHLKVKILMPVYCIKWCCIILNDFLPVDAARRQFAKTSENTLSQKQIQLAKAKAKLSTLRSMKWRI